VAIGAIIGAVACLELATGTGNVVGDAIMRATATYSHPNNLALFIERMLLLTLPCVLRFRQSGLLWACVGLQGVGVVSTFSRGALVAVVVGTAAAMLVMRMRRELLWMGGLVIAGGLVLVAIARDRILDAGGSGSEPTRFAIWRSAIRMGLDHPVFGVGLDQFLYQYSRRYIEPAAWPERYTSHPHNLALDMWLRLGVAGIASFLAVVAGIILRVGRSLPTIRGDAIAVGGLSALVGGLAHGMFDNGFFLPDLAVLTWLAVALLVTAESDPRQVSA
jgi:O-antigen ligase